MTFALKTVLLMVLVLRTIFLCYGLLTFISDSMIFAPTTFHIMTFSPMNVALMTINPYAFFSTRLFVI
jgi:hypothetical protein